MAILSPSSKVLLVQCKGCKRDVPASVSEMPSWYITVRCSMALPLECVSLSDVAKTTSQIGRDSVVPLRQYLIGFKGK
jgi:hypothetical protein